MHASRGKEFISPVSNSEYAEAYLTLAVPLRNSSNDIGGILVARVNLTFLSVVLAEIHFGHGGYAYRVDKYANLIAHRDISTNFTQPNLKNLPKLGAFLENSALDKRPGEEIAGITGDQVLSSYAPIATLGWAVVIEEPV